MKDEVKAVEPSFRPSAFRLPPSFFHLWLERATVACLFLYAAAAPHSIAGTQTAWLLAMALWAARLCVRPRPKLFRTPVDKWLLGFFVFNLGNLIHLLLVVLLIVVILRVVRGRGAVP